ncbi:Ig-like domain repeat protein [Microbacterium testaceum]|uniref:Ig-like domain repeat protein n=1 Tax=Microbacterium testaceum TaxID=2033 RepID=UPI0011AFCC9C|nr:Ig-like domain repeat protein [Microbacterium testaceum]
MAVIAALTLTGATTAQAADTSCSAGVCVVSFSFHGTAEEWDVPAGVTSITASVAGGSGGHATSGGGLYAGEKGAGGLGGAVRATLPVQAGDKLKAVVGGAGQDGVGLGSPAVGGYGGGASAGKKNDDSPYGGGGGGGGSFLFNAGSLSLAAGGGGGASVANQRAVRGGAGGSVGAGSSGGSPGGSSSSYIYSGGGATATGPGAGGGNYVKGAPGSSYPASGPSAFGFGGGGGNNGGFSSYFSSGSGGGGGGYFGGGGGGNDGVASGGQEVGAGGGGSGFVASNATNVVSLSGNTGDGSIVITYDEPKDTTTLEVKASDNPNDATATTLTAVVSPATATGSVTFTDGSTELGSATLTDGVATLSKTLASGTHTITASYSGDAAYGTSTTSTKVTVTAYSAPSFDTDSTADAPIEKNVVAGQSFSFDDLVATGVPGPTYSVENDDSDDSVLPDGVAFSDGVLSGTTTHAGTWQIMVTATNSVGTATEHVRLTVAPGPTTALEAAVFPGDAASTTTWAVAPDGTVTESSNGATTADATITADQGDTITFRTTPIDQYGNVTTGGAVDPVTLSSVESDTITYDSATNLTSVRFNHASPHVITFKVGTLTNSFTVQVTPATAAPSFSTDSTSDAPITERVIAGQSFSFDFTASGTPTPTYSIENDDADSIVLPDGVTFTNGILAGSSTRAGTWKIKVTATNSLGTATEYVKLTIAPGTATALEAAVSPGDSSSTTLWAVAPDGTVTEPSNSTANTTITANQGDSIVFETMPVDQYGNPTTKGNVQPVTTSSIDTDTITYDPTTNLTTVTFNHASPHVITFTIGGLTNSFAVQVTPTPTPSTSASATTSTSASASTGTPASSSGSTSTSNHLAITGSAPLAPLGWALCILAAGVAVMLLQRHRTTRRPN